MFQLYVPIYISIISLETRNNSILRVDTYPWQPGSISFRCLLEFYFLHLKPWYALKYISSDYINLLLVPISIINVQTSSGKNTWTIKKE